MPRYEYQCQTCFHVFEIRQSFSSDPVATCPICNNGARRVIHSVPVVFKGSGWYVSDYGKGDSSSNSSPKARESGPKTETKPESAAASGPTSKVESKKESASSK